MQNMTLIARLVQKTEQLRQKTRLIQTRIIHYCFLGIQEFNNFIKINIVFSFIFCSTMALYSGYVVHFFNHINHNRKIAPVNIYNCRKRQMLTQLFRWRVYNNQRGCIVLHLYQNKLELDAHAGLAKSKEFFCIDGHFVMERFGYIKNNMNLARVF